MVKHAHDSHIQDIDFSRNGLLMASIDGDQILKVWQYRSGSLNSIAEMQLDMRKGYGASLKFMTDRQLVAYDRESIFKVSWESKKISEINGFEGVIHDVNRAGLLLTANHNRDNDASALVYDLKEDATLLERISIEPEIVFACFFPESKASQVLVLNRHTGWIISRTYRKRVEFRLPYFDRDCYHSFQKARVHGKLFFTVTRGNGCERLYDYEMRPQRIRAWDANGKSIKQFREFDSVQDVVFEDPNLISIGNTGKIWSTPNRYHIFSRFTAPIVSAFITNESVLYLGTDIKAFAIDIKTLEIKLEKKCHTTRINEIKAINNHFATCSYDMKTKVFSHGRLLFSFEDEKGHIVEFTVYIRLH
jgi:WD40 repeat protein